MATYTLVDLSERNTLVDVLVDNKRVLTRVEESEGLRYILNTMTNQDRYEYQCRGHIHAVRTKEQLLDEVRSANKYAVERGYEPYVEVE